MGRMQRRKGHSFERAIARALHVVFPEARRQLEYNEHDAKGVDIQATGRFKIQCKRGRKYAAITAIEEVNCDRLIAGEVPVLITQADQCEIMVVLPFSDFLDLLKKAGGK